MGTAEIDRALGDSERLLLDSSTLIAFHSPHERAHPLADHVLTRISSDSDPLHGYFSNISAVELLVRPMRAGPERLAFMHAFLTEFPHLSSLPVDFTVAVQTATLRAMTGLALADTLVIASGLLANCEAIVTNDHRWMTRCAPHFRQFRWVYLEDYC
ncbi:MAG: type II toxin-antitoxin system VapC family toxin [Dehalococcoidia bacterium]